MILIDASWVRWTTTAGERSDDSAGHVEAPVGHRIGAEELRAIRIGDLEVIVSIRQTGCGRGSFRSGPTVEVYIACRTVNVGVDGASIDGGCENCAL